MAPGGYGAGHSLLARCRWLPEAGQALAGWRPVRLHLLASEVLGRVRALAPPELAAGAEGIVELRLQAPVVAARGDRLVLRRPSPAATLGGGEILDPRWHRRRGPVRQRAVAAIAAGGDAALLEWVREGGEGGAATGELARRLGRRESAVAPELDALARHGKLLRVAAGAGRETRWIAPDVVQRVAARAARVLEEHFRRDRLADAMPKAEALRRMLRGRGGDLGDLYLQWLEGEKVLRVVGDAVTLPGRRAELSGEESKLATAVAERYDRGGLTPPSPGEVARDLGAKPQILDGVVTYLVRQKRLVRLPGGLLLSRTVFGSLVEQLRATGWERFTVPEFKERFELSRKWAIPLLEQLDSEGATRRLGDQRMVVR